MKLKKGDTIRLQDGDRHKLIIRGHVGMEKEVLSGKTLMVNGEQSCLVGSKNYSAYYPTECLSRIA